MSYTHASGTHEPAALDVLSRVQVRVGATTHPGRRRSENEDSYLAEPPVFLVADGMGGHQLGAAASAAVVDSFRDLAAIPAITPHHVEERIEISRRAILDLATSEPRQPGSTVVSATLVDQGGRAYWLLANVGDSRAYLLSDGELTQLSHDHSVVQELIDAGTLDEADASGHAEKHVITRALGALADSPADYSLIPVVNRSRLLLCSDGISSELGAADLMDVLAVDVQPQLAADELVRQAVARGGRDNATAVVIDVHVLSGDHDDDAADTTDRDNAMADTRPGNGGA